jgi:hypothetical protein
MQTAGRIVLVMCFVFCISNASQAQEKENTLELIEIKKIWDKAPHNGMPDLVRFKGVWFCALREGQSHVSLDGKIRILKSSEGKEWESVALISGESDQRAPQLTVTPKNKLMLNFFRRYGGKDVQKQHSFAIFSDDGQNWTEPVKIGFPMDWLWRITWHEGKAYGMSYDTSPPYDERKCKGNLYVSDNGSDFKRLSGAAKIQGGNESTIRFDSDGTAYCLRRQKGWGVSKPPYTNWTWSRTIFVGGPNFIILPDGRMIAGGRLHDKERRTSLLWVDPSTGRLSEALTLPVPAYDGGYPGLVLQDDVLWVTYYSGSKEEAAVNLAKVRIGGLEMKNAPVLDIGSRLELFIDDYMIDHLGGKAEVRLHHPEPKEIAINHDRGWEGRSSIYHSIFRDGDLYRMYYRGEECYAYAESDDGIHWRKPELGLYEHRISKTKSDNNIVIPNKANKAFFRDDNPNVPSDERYKAIQMLPQYWKEKDEAKIGLYALKSADGIHWEQMSPDPIITDGKFDSQNVAFWDSERGEYRAYWRVFLGGIRSIRTATSRDFIHWEDQADLRYGDSPKEQLYTNVISPYYRAPHVVIGFPVRITYRGWSESMRALPQLKEREERAKVKERAGTALTEALLMASRDRVTFKRWNEAFLRPGIERPGTWEYGQQYVAWSLVETKSALEGAPNELSLYASESYRTGPTRLRRYTLRIDGFVSVSAPMDGGELVTKLLTFTGDKLVLNFSSSAAGGIQVEILDKESQTIPGFKIEDSPPIFGDSIERVVSWEGGRELSSLQGKPIRLRFVLKDADLYSFRFK